MAGWALPLLLVGLGGTAAIALASNATKPPPPPPRRPPPGGPSNPYTLDANMPQSLRDRVYAALAVTSDPAQLEAFAQAIASIYPFSAAALRAKERALLAHQFVLPPNPLDLLTGVPDPPRSAVVQQLLTNNNPSALEAFAVQLQASFPMAASALRLKAVLLAGQGAQPQPAPQPIPTSPPPFVPQPQPVPAPSPFPIPPDPVQVTPPPAQPPPPIFVPPPPPIVVPQPAPPPDPAPIPLPPPPGPPVVVGPPPQPIPTSPGIPAPPFPAPPLPLPVPPPPPGFTLDPGMPPAVQTAVIGALTTEDDPATLKGFAASIQAIFPISAGLLQAKANAILLAQGQLGHAPLPQPSPQVPVPPPQPVIGPPSIPQPAPAALFPIGDESTRSGINAGRPVRQFPFVVIGGSGPGNAPITIAKFGSGSESNFMKLQPLNPHYRIGQDAEHPGLALNVPWTWAKKLADVGYDVRQDAGAVPPPDAGLTPTGAPPGGVPSGVTTTLALHTNGAPNAAHA